MEVDKTTLEDLSIFSAYENSLVFKKLNFCITTGGSDTLLENLKTPITSISEITDIQKTIAFISQNKKKWPTQISNGGIMVIEKFFPTGLDTIPSNPSAFAAYTYKLFHAPDFSLAIYSVKHCFEFLHGMQLFAEQSLQADTPRPLAAHLQRIVKITHTPVLHPFKKYAQFNDVPLHEQLHLASFVKYRFKQHMFELMDIYFQLDAWYSMSEAMERYHFSFPQFKESDSPFIKAKGLYHLLLPKPIDYDIELNNEQNFLFLTGANMAGKSTFIKSVGIAIFLAHLGMGVPAQQLELSYCDGLLSNINAADNIIKGESYFYNEVQRIKSTITKISDGRKWLILIDELFKGTNVQDAMKCSSSVIEGLLKMKNSIFILSTHLYEISDELKKYPNIKFSYFETNVVNDQLQFEYQLKDGISNDRLGYLILQKEGVVDLLKSIPE